LTELALIVTGLTLTGFAKPHVFFIIRTKLILLSPVSVSEWGDIGPGYLNGVLGKLRFYLSAQKQTYRIEGLMTAAGR